MSLYGVFVTRARSLRPPRQPITGQHQFARRSAGAQRMLPAAGAGSRFLLTSRL